MIRHIVLLTLREDADAAAHVSIREALETLPGRVPSIVDYEVAIDEGLAEGNASISVIADFEDVAGWEAYRDHPAHRRIIEELIAPNLADRKAIQFRR
jgi:hypothetical protein